jgi:hypothetical protein
MADKDQAEPQPESALVPAGTLKRRLSIAGEDQDTKDNIDGEEMEEMEEEMEETEEIEEEEDVQPLKKNQLPDCCPKNPLAVSRCPKNPLAGNRNVKRPKTTKWH